MAIDENPAGLEAPAQQLRTYHGFLVGVRYVVLAHIVLGTLLILGFCTATPWLGAVAVAAIELAVGLFFAWDRKTLAWPSQVATLVMTTAAESGQHGVGRLERRERVASPYFHPAE